MCQVKLRSIGWVLVVLTGMGCVDPSSGVPSAKDARVFFEETLASPGDGCTKLMHLEKTGDVSRVEWRQGLYGMEWEASFVVEKDCYSTTSRIYDEPIFVLREMKPPPLSRNLARDLEVVKAGTTVKYAGVLVFEKTDPGWKPLMFERVWRIP